MKEKLKYFFNMAALGLSRIAACFSKPLPGGNALIVRTDNLGDLIIFVPALKELCAYYKGNINLVVSEAAFEFALGLKDRGIRIANVVCVNRRRFNYNFLYKVAFLWRISRRRYDLAIAPAFSRDSIADTIIAVSTAKKKIGWHGDMNNNPVAGWYDGGYTELLENQDRLSGEMKRNNFLAAHITDHAVAEEASFSLLPSDNDTAVQLLRHYGLEGAAYAVIAPGAGASYRIWPLERFAAVAKHIYSQGLQPVIVGTASERELAEGIKQRAGVPIVDMTGKTPVYTLAAVLARAAVFFGSESGPLHLAAAVETPTLCIMGGGHFRRFFPWADSPCQRIVFDEHMACRLDNWECGKQLPPGLPAPCIKAISAEAAIKILDQMI